MCIMHFFRCLICHQIVQYVCMCVYVVVFVSPSTCNRFFGVISWAVVVRIPRSIHICTHTFLCSPSVSTSAAMAAVYCYWCHLCTPSPSSPPELLAHTHTQTHFQCHWHCSPYQLVASLCFGCVWVTLFRLLESQNWKSDQSVCD